MGSKEDTMSIRTRDLLYAFIVSVLAVLAIAIMVIPVYAQAVWPAPVVAGGAMPVEWHDIVHPTPTDWVGLYAPESGEYAFIEWIYVSCSQQPNFARSTGTCGFVIPSTVPPGVYEIRLYAADGFSRLATSPHIEVLDGGWR